MTGAADPTRPAGDVPASSLDLYSDAVLAEPYAAYRELRETGPVVYLGHAGAYALPRHAEVRAVLEDHARFVSGQGVGLSDFGNQSRRGTPIASDPPLHTLVRGVVADRLSLKSVRNLTPELEAKAESLVERLLVRRSFDGVADLARPFVLGVMADLIGLPDDGREHILRWADAGFNLFGPPNARSRAAEQLFPEVVTYIRSLEAPGRLRPGSVGAFIYAQAEEGRLSLHQCGPLMVSYLMAGLDTTIDAISAALFLFGRHPDQWDAVRAKPSLLPTAFNEVIRLETPIQNLRRVAKEAVEIDGFAIPAGASVLVMYGSANRDERRWPEPDRFDATRNPAGHMAFGAGIHNCPGQILARVETVSVLKALATRVKRIEVGAPVWHLNNIIRGLERLPVTLHA